MKVMCR